jgi:DNA-binding ferritin-like protein (Dps family)
MFEGKKVISQPQPWKVKEDFKQMQAKAKAMASKGMNQYEINAILWNSHCGDIEDRVIFETAEQAVNERN